MEKDKHKTIVVFRVWNSGGVIALFPEIVEGPGHCSSYEHVGQHAAAGYDTVVIVTRPARPEEYADLARELEGCGYNLDVRTRYTRKRRDTASCDTRED